MVKNKQSNLITGAKMLNIGVINNRRAVEDTRLEAKNTKKSEAKAKDSPSENRPFRGQGQECSRPKTQTKVVFSKKSLQKIFFRRSPKKAV